MPRRRRGTPAQADVPTGRPYGDGGQLRADITQGNQAISQMPSAGNPAPVPTPAPPGAVSPEVLAAAQAAEPPNLTSLRAASERPNEPVTAGIARGPGPGPEALALPAPDHVADTFEMLGQVLHDPTLLRLAGLARRQRR